jgi:hypothetical protein
MSHFEISSLRVKAHQGNWQPQHNPNFRQLLSHWVEHKELNGAAQIEEMAMQLQCNSRKTEKLNSQATKQASLLKAALLHSFLLSAFLTCFCDSFLLMTWKVDKAANFVSVQLIEQKLGIYDKCDTDYARQDKIDLAWERISWEEMKEPGSSLSSFETI